MNIIKIAEPIWKDRSVGILEEKTFEDFKVEITYIDKKGNKIYPDTYFMSAQKAKRYPTKVFKGYLRIKTIPIKDFEVIKAPPSLTNQIELPLPE